MNIFGYQASEHAKGYGMALGGLALSVVGTATTVGLVMEQRRWFFGGLAIGTVVAGTLSHKQQDPIYSRATQAGHYVKAGFTCILNRNTNPKIGPSPARKRLANYLFIGVPVVATGIVCVSAGSVSYVVGLLLPKIVASGSGLTTGLTLGFTAVILPKLTLEKIPKY